MATLQERLAEAEACYHDWSVGKGIRKFVDQNGETLEYSVPNLARLASYIADLKRQVDSDTDLGPMRCFF